MGVLQRYKREERAGKRAMHEGRGTYINKQKDLGINTDEATARTLREQEKDFQSQVATKRGEIGELESKVLRHEQDFKGDMIPVKYYTSSGDVYNYNLTRDTAKSLYNNPDTFAVYGEDKGQKYVPINRDQARYHEGSNKNLEGYKITREEIQGRETDGGYANSTYRTTVKQTPGDYKQNVLHLKAGTSKGSHPFAKALNDIQRQTDAQVKLAQKSFDTSKEAVSGAKGVLQGTVDQRKDEWDAVHAKYAKRTETMRKILGGLDFG